MIPSADQLDLETLSTVGKASWVPSDGISAHCKVDTTTGELFFFNYSKKAPFMHYGVVKGSRLTHYQPIPLPGPRLPHDMAISRRHAILCDLPLFWDPALLERDIHATRFYPELPSRFGVVPRAGGAVRWFEASPCFVLHFLNCYEEGDDLVLEGYRQLSPMPKKQHPAAPDAPRGHERMMASPPFPRLFLNHRRDFRFRLIESTSAVDHAHWIVPPSAHRCTSTCMP